MHLTSKTDGIECGTDQFETTSTGEKRGNKILETLRSRLSEGLQKDCRRGLGETSDM